MEAIIELLQTPGGALLLELVSVGGLIWLFLRIERLARKLIDHEIECARRWGVVATKLKIDEDL